MSKAYFTMEFLFAYYAPKGVVAGAICLTKLTIQCLTLIVVMPIGSFTYSRLTKDIFLILAHSFVFLVGAILFLSALLGNSKNMYLVAYFLIRVGFALYVSLTFKFLTSYTNCWRYQSISKQEGDSLFNFEGLFIAVDGVCQILHNQYFKELNRDSDFTILTFIGIYMIVFAFLVLIISNKMIFSLTKSSKDKLG